MNGEEGGGLSAGRSRRSTAGNRMRELLEQERERLELKRGNEDDEMFKEEEGDVDFEAKMEEAEDIIDSDFDQSSDEGEEDDDELQGEKEIEEEERLAKKQSRVKAAPVGIRKATAPKPIQPSNGVEGHTVPAKRILFASVSTSGEGGKQRSSTRKSTINASLSVQARMKLEEKRRQEFSERAIPKRKKVRLSQADRISEALEMEDYNRESLSKYFKMEEERREKDRKRGQKDIKEPFIRFRSVAEDRNVQQRMVQVIQEERKQAEKAEAAISNGIVTVDPVIAAREGARKEREGQTGMAVTEPAGTDQTAFIRKDDEVAPSEEVVEGGEASMQHSRTTTTSDIVMTDKEGQPHGERDGQMNTDVVVQAEAEQDVDQGETAVQLTETEEKEMEEAPSDAIDVAVEVAAPDFETRTYISLHQLPGDTTWQDSWSYILGSHVDWSHYNYVPARNRPLRPRQSVCPITGLAAMYKDPRSGIAYANKEAYETLTRVMTGCYQWSGRPISESSLNRNYDPMEMGCWLDSLDERGACQVLDKASSKAGPVLYRTKATVAPGDEQAIVAAAQALPAGSTRSGSRRAHDI